MAGAPIDTPSKIFLLVGTALGRKHCYVVVTEPQLSLVDETHLDCALPILENGHRRAHTHETKLFIKAFFSWIRVQNYFFVACLKLFKVCNDLPAQAYALIIRMNCDIAKVRTVDAVRQCSPYADQFHIVEYKAFIPAVRKRNFQIFRFFVAEGRYFV